MFPLLNKVFRGKGNPAIPQNHSTVADHEVGIINITSRVFARSNAEMLAIKQRVNATALLHDLPELIGEISTYFQRLKGEKYNLHESDRVRLEADIAKILFYLALKACKENDDKILNPIYELQNKLATETNQYERYKYAEEKFVKPQTTLMEQALQGCDQDLNQAHEELMQAHDFMENGVTANSGINPKDKYTALLCKLLDKLESQYYIGTVMNLNQADPNLRQKVINSFEPVKKIFIEFQKITDQLGETFGQLTPATKEFYNECVQLYISKTNNGDEIEQLKSYII